MPAPLLDQPLAPPTSGSAGDAASARPWPGEELEDVGACPACARSRRLPLYGGLSDRLFGSGGRWDLWRCLDCRAAYLHPRPRPEAMGRAYRTYYTHHQPGDGPVAGAGGSRRRRGLRRVLLSAWERLSVGGPLIAATRSLPLLPRVVRNDASFAAAAAAASASARSAPDGALRVLDVGCGNGEFLARMRALGWDGEGIDIDARGVQAARAAGVPARIATLADLVREEPARHFDAIALDHVLEHLYDPVGTLRDARRLLKPGGFVWIATPNLSSLGHRAFRRAWTPLDPPRHVVLFSPDALRSALRSAGFPVQLEQPAARTACWVFTLSGATGDGPSRLAARAPLARRLQALLADLAARRRPALAEELVVVARSEAA